ncbi:MAG: TonB-dependent receptor plug domain-containing protein [Acidobacteria bacterium]|nr:TonB-dependent receptor plug domain-containing protein [Acidobacteriota bacterium]
MGHFMRSLLLILTLAPVAAAQTAGDQHTPADLLEPLHESITISATPLGPRIDLRNAEVFNKTLFTRDDQLFHLLDGGINAGQHEGGGKSLEIRRFGFNLDHGGVNGGLRVTVDNVAQNHATQGHGQGYLGSLKSLSPELVDEVTLINGPFSAEHGDFSGLGVVQIRLKESMPDVWTARLQGGSFETARGFLSWSPNVDRRDALFAYEGSHSDGPFLRPLNYNRHNVSGNYAWLLGKKQRFGFKWNGGTNDFQSSGQVPLDEVAAGRLDRYGAIGQGDGGNIRQGRIGGYFRRDLEAGAVLKLDGFVERSLFDLYSNFTFYLNDPVRGDGIQQHDSRLSQGGNAQYLRPHFFKGHSGILTVGGSVLSSQNLVELRQSVLRDPISLTTSAHAAVTNGGGYIQEQIDVWNGRVELTGGLRWDVFRYAITDRLEPQYSGVETAAKPQPKASVAVRPFGSLPLRGFFNYGRGISSLDARGVVRRPESPHINTTDFLQWGVQHNIGQRFSMLADYFLIKSSNQLVYIPDDGTIELSDPSTSYGYETKASFAITHHLSVNGGITKVLNAYYRNTEPRLYVSTAPHFVSNAALTLSGWRGWSGSLRVRAINRYRLDDADPTIRAAGHTVFDFALTRRLAANVDFNLAVDNLLGRSYWEMQNYFESQLPGQAPTERIHGTPGYGRTVVAGLSIRFGGK